MTDGWDARYLEASWSRYERHLHVMRLDVTRAQWDEGLAHLARLDMGMQLGEQVHTVYALLYRLTPYWAATQGWIPTDPAPPVQTFTGWDRLRAELQQDLRGLSNAEAHDFLLGAFGQDALPLLAVLLAT